LLLLDVVKSLVYLVLFALGRNQMIEEGSKLGGLRIDESISSELDEKNGMRIHYYRFQLVRGPRQRLPKQTCGNL
jgi:hypothetical protein